MSFSDSRKYLTEKELRYYYKEYIKQRDYSRADESDVVHDTPGGSILDSSLISQTKLQKYNIKVIDMGDFKQIYIYDDTKYKSNKVVFDDSDLIKKSKFVDFDKWQEEQLNKSKKEKKKIIENKNITRTRINIQRLVKANINNCNTWITLTFDINKNKDIDITDVEQANKKLNIWKTYIKKLKNDFLYIGIIEFQKRGAIHYHFLTNINYNSIDLLSQEIKIYNKKTGWQIGKQVKGWKYGYSLAKNLQDINVVGYLDKYMTKEKIDARLFNKKRYFHSLNVRKPTESFLEIGTEKEILLFLQSLNDMSVCYDKVYNDKFGNDVKFIEYSKNQNYIDSSNITISSTTI